MIVATAAAAPASKATSAPTTAASTATPTAAGPTPATDLCGLPLMSWTRRRIGWSHGMIGNRMKVGASGKFFSRGGERFAFRAVEYRPGAERLAEMRADLEAIRA